MSIDQLIHSSSFDANFVFQLYRNSKYKLGKKTHSSFNSVGIFAHRFRLGSLCMHAGRRRSSELSFLFDFFFFSFLMLLSSPLSLPRQLFTPNRPFHNFRASKSGDRLILCCSETSSDGEFWGSKVARGSVGLEQDHGEARESGSAFELLLLSLLLFQLGRS